MRQLFLLFLFLFPILLSAQSCNPDSLVLEEVRARDTDSNIPWELNRHHVFFNPTCSSQHTLLVHLVGSYDNPSSTLLYPELAANHGFHVVSLKYPNSTAAQSACGTSSDPDCYLNFRREILEGIDYSTETSVDSSDCVYNRLIKLLQYQHSQHPAQGWDQFFTGNTVNWSEVIVSGHSQGGGHAAVIAIDKPVKRVLMFASPNDFSTFFNAPALWTSAPHLAPDSAYFGFNNLIDNVVDFSEQFQQWSNLGMAAFGDSVFVEAVGAPYGNSHQLYTTYDTTGIGGTHSVMILDSKTPLDGQGLPLFAPVWEYMLGLNGPMTQLDPEDPAPDLLFISPNPTRQNCYLQLNLSPGEQANIRVLDVLGREQATFFNLEENRIELNSANFEPGVYFIELTLGNEYRETKKMVKW